MQVIDSIPNVLALSVDSLAVAWLIGPWIIPGMCWRLAVAFGLSDLLGTLAGQLLGFSGCVSLMAALVLAACGGYAVLRRHPSRRPASLYLLPMLLGTDSLLFPVQTSDVMFLGIISGGLVYLGLLTSAVLFSSVGQSVGCKAAFLMVPCLMVLL